MGSIRHLLLLSLDVVDHTIPDDWLVYHIPDKNNIGLFDPTPLLHVAAAGGTEVPSRACISLAPLTACLPSIQQRFQRFSASCA
mgnify:CR=1 FL=1